MRQCEPVFAHALERRADAPEFQLLQHHFLIGLREQQIAAVVLAEHFIEQSARRLQLRRALFCCPVCP